MSQKIADGFGQLGELEDYHYSFVQNGKITLVGRKYVAQPTHNWGHRVAFGGSYVLTFDKESQKWEKHEFSALVNDENAEESLFVKDGSLYLIIFTNFGAIEFLKLFKWESDSFVELSLSAPAKKSFDESYRTGVVATAETAPDGSIVLVSGDDDGGVSLYSLAVDENKADIKQIGIIDKEENNLRGKPVLANVYENKVLISYGVHGCGFRWENNALFIFDLTSKSVKHVRIEGEWSDFPKFGFVGPHVAAVNTNTKSWIVASGSIQQGMCGSAHYGAVWVLKKVFEAGSAPVWEEQPQTIEAGEHVLDGLTLYTVTKESITSIELDNV